MPTFSRTRTRRRSAIPALALVLGLLLGLTAHHVSLAAAGPAFAHHAVQELSHTRGDEVPGCAGASCHSGDHSLASCCAMGLCLADLPAPASLFALGRLPVPKEDNAPRLEHFWRSAGIERPPKHA